MYSQNSYGLRIWYKKYILVDYSDAEGINGNCYYLDPTDLSIIGHSYAEEYNGIDSKIFNLKHVFMEYKTGELNENTV